MRTERDEGRSIYVSRRRIAFILYLMWWQTIKYERCALNEVSGTLAQRHLFPTLAGDFRTSRGEKMEA